MQRLFIFTMLSAVFLFAFKQGEKIYPKNDFSAPVNFPIRLSGTFAELRPNHFHGGLDIKPSKTNLQGDPILAIGDGYISRIQVSAYGYGNALYVTHPNGYTSVYAHLQKFVPTIADYTMEKHYQSQSFELDLMLTPDKFPVSKGEQIGYLGTTGGSFGPHLHFEIQETRTEKTINPLFFGFDVADDKNPILQQLKIYELNHNHETVANTNYELKNVANGQYTLATPLLEISSNRIAIGLKAYDNVSGTTNANGIYSMDILQDNALIYRFEMEQFSYDETYYFNAHLDYGAWMNNEGFFNRGYRLKGNYQQNFYKALVNDGIIKLNNEPTVIEIIARDFHGNESHLKFSAKRSLILKTPESQVFNYLFPYNEGNIVKRSDIELYFRDSSFFENTYANIKVGYDGSSNVYSSTFHIHDEEIPIYHSFEIRLKPQRPVPEQFKSKLYISKCKNDEKSYIGGTWKGDWLTAKAPTFGNYTILLDTVAPKITPIEYFGMVKPSPRLSFKITENETDLKSYHAWVDNQWILMKHDAKMNLIYHQFDERVTTGEHHLKIVVTDLRGNKAIFEGKFIR